MQAFENESTADSLEAQALALERAGRTSEATEYFKRIYAIRERLFSLSSPKTLQSGIDVARCLSAKDQHREALPYSERALGWIRSNPSRIDTQSANRVKRLHGTILRGVGRLDEAATVYEELLASNPQGDERTQTLNGLAGIYSDLGMYPEALDYYWEIHANVSKSEGSDSEVALTILNNIAVLYTKAQYNPEKALETLQKVYNGYLKKRGETYPATISTAGSIIGALHRMGRAAEAETWGRKTLRVAERVYGEENQPTLSIANQLGIILNELHKYEEAEDLLSDCLESLTKLYGPNHSITLTTRCNLASSLRGRGDAHGALKEQLAAHSGMAASLGPGHPSVRIILQEVISLQKQLGLSEDAIKNQEQLLEQMLLSGPAHRGHALCMADLIKMYKENGDVEKARAAEARLARLQAQI